MEAIARNTVRDRHALFQYTDDGGRLREKGFMITINACSDLKAVQMCRSVRDFAKHLTCDLVLAVENYQRRGGVQIYRPHAHLLVDVERPEANSIAEHFKRLGGDVEVDRMIEIPHLLKYLSKDPTGSFYCKRIPVTEPVKGSPPPTLPEVEEAVDPAPRMDIRPTERKNIVGLAQNVHSSIYPPPWTVRSARSHMIRPWLVSQAPLTMIRAP